MVKIVRCTMARLGDGKGTNLIFGMCRSYARSLLLVAIFIIRVLLVIIFVEEVGNADHEVG